MEIKKKSQIINKNCITYSSTVFLVGILDQSLAYRTGETCSCGSRSMCMCNIKWQNAARNEDGRLSSAMHLKHKFSPITRGKHHTILRKNIPQI